MRVLAGYLEQKHMSNFVVEWKSTGVYTEKKGEVGHRGLKRVNKPTEKCSKSDFKYFTMLSKTAPWSRLFINQHERSGRVRVRKYFVNTSWVMNSFPIGRTYLHGGAHGKGKLTQWTFQNVDESNRNKDFLSIQNVLLINQYVNSKHR